VAGRPTQRNSDRPWLQRKYVRQESDHVGRSIVISVDDLNLQAGQAHGILRGAGIRAVIDVAKRLQRKHEQSRQYE
jgi:hypothetical protein